MEDLADDVQENVISFKDRFTESLKTLEDNNEINNLEKCEHLISMILKYDQIRATDIISSKSQSDAEKKLLWILLFMDGKISVSDTDEICTSLCKNAIDWRKKICNLCLKGKFWKSGSLNLKMAELLLIAFRRVRRGKQIST
eukprot:GHVP01049804.1.p1 GENE.GHVP01049804.1~~GHVP01049804.1.p1  ORF type:complete len:142 (+),score=30.86 GHVP01049804.1:773-1198(+)